MPNDKSGGKSPTGAQSPGAKAAIGRANRRAEEAENRLGRAMKRNATNKANLKRTAHHAAQVGVTVGTASALSYVEGRYGTSKLEVAGTDARMVGGVLLTGGGLVAELLTDGHPGASYATALGVGTLTSYSCSKALAAGQKAALKAGVVQQPVPAPGGNEAQLLNELKATPEVPAKAAGSRGVRRPKRRIEPNPSHPEVPPHLAHLLRRREMRAAA